MKQEGREDLMLSKGKEDEKKATGRVKKEDWGIKCFILYLPLPTTVSLFFLLTTLTLPLCTSPWMIWGHLTPGPFILVYQFPQIISDKAEAKCLEDVGTVMMPWWACLG